MIIRNKHATQEIGVTNKNYEQIFLKPWEECEVEDAQGRWYLANYSEFFEKTDVSTISNAEKDEEIVMMKKQISTLTTLVERLVNGKDDDLSDEEKKLIENSLTVSEDEAKLKAEIIELLKSKWVKGVWNHRSLSKLIKAREELKEDEIDVVDATDTLPETAETQPETTDIVE